MAAMTAAPAELSRLASEVTETDGDVVAVASAAERLRSGSSGRHCAMQSRTAPRSSCGRMRVLGLRCCWRSTTPLRCGSNGCSPPSCKGWRSLLLRCSMRRPTRSKLLAGSCVG